MQGYSGQLSEGLFSQSSSHNFGSFEAARRHPRTVAAHSTRDENRQLDSRAFEGALPHARIIGTELHDLAAQYRRMRAVTADDRRVAISLLGVKQTEAGIYLAAVANQAISHPIGGVESARAKRSRLEVAQGIGCRGCQLLREPGSDTGIERAGERFSHKSLPPATETAMGVGRAEADLISPQSVSASQISRRTLCNLPRNDKGVGRDDDARRTSGREGDRFDPYFIMNSRRGLAMTIPIPGEWDRPELSGFGTIHHRAHFGGEGRTSEAGPKIRGLGFGHLGLSARSRRQGLIHRSECRRRAQEEETGQNCQ